MKADSRNSDKSASFANQSSSNEATNRSSLHNNEASRNAFETGNMTDVLREQHDNTTASDRTHARNDLFRNTRATATNRNESGAFNWNNTRADQSANSENMNSLRSQNDNKRYTTLSNLSNLKSNHFVLKLDVTANNESSVVRVFTGNNNNSIAANQDFNHSFANCGGAGIIKAPILAPTLAPAAAAEAAAIEPLGDRVAKPE